MSTTDRFLITTQPEFSREAFSELQKRVPQAHFEQELAPGISLCAAPRLPALLSRLQREPAIFIRHIAPVQATIELTQTEGDLEQIALAVANLPSFSLLGKGQHFAIQSRFVQGDTEKPKRPFTTGILNRMLAEAFVEETGAIEDMKHPEIVISLLCTGTYCYMGISLAVENISNWPGGARHYAHLPEQISRAELKLLEALEVFSLTLPVNGVALDLGAAPGGWTRLLLEAGLRVTAVDPAELDSRLASRQNLKHIRGYAEDYIQQDGRPRRFDLITNDMRMDARDAARLLAYAATNLKEDGIIISVFKLPHATPTHDPFFTLQTAMQILQQSYRTVEARQLFHNRQEVTVVAAHPYKRA